MIDILLSGLIGALIATIITIGYTEYKESCNKRISIAREKLEKVYGPLVALKKKIDKRSGKELKYIIASNPAEGELIEKILFHYYHLVDDDLKEGIVLLQQENTQHGVNLDKQVELKVIEKIFKYYEENKRILGLK